MKYQLNQSISGREVIGGNAGILQSAEFPKSGKFCIKEPGSALTHLIAFAFAVLATPFMLIRYAQAGADLIAMAGAAVFMMSMVLLYAASTTYHSFDISEKANLVLKKIDHMMIPVLIAGSYTPACLTVLRGRSGYRLLLIVWSIAAAEMLFKIFWVTCPKWVSSVIYIAMGWVCLMYLPQIVGSVGPAGFFWLLAGGLIYTVGGVIYAMKFPVFGGRFRYFGSHELFHVFVMAGSLCHFAAVYGCMV